MTGPVCRCGQTRCVIRVSWQGDAYKFWVDRNGRPHDFGSALEDLRRINTEIKDGTFRPGDYIPRAIRERLFESLFAKWMDKRAPHIAPSNKHGTYFKYYAPLYARSVREIRLKDLQEWYDGLPFRLSANYRKKMTDCLMTFFRWCLRWGEIDKLPVFPEVEKPIYNPRKAIDYGAQMEALGRIPLPYRAIIEFLMETGLRPGEACVLKLSDLDARMRTMTVRRTLSAGQVRETTKGRSNIVIPLSDRAWEIVRNAAGDTIGDQWVFMNPVTRKHYSTEFLRKMWRNHSGIEADLYSATRHSFCTQLVEAGVSEIEAQGLMRHKDARSTRAYFHPTIERQRDHLNKRSNIIKLERVKK